VWEGERKGNVRVSGRERASERVLAAARRRSTLALDARKKGGSAVSVSLSQTPPLFRSTMK
jgi:hypothetical protein